MSFEALGLRSIQILKNSTIVLLMKLCLLMINKYRITRIDGEEDKLTSQSFDSYDEAYDLLEEIYGDICCSDADYEDRPYYQIIKMS
ncbi:hypothetical protein [Prochlorococcus sp. MIT 1223]|uniref:hypothetical protein n=1 Tax=Prochlorococcus sp. MIT 1223 TaxID=3096217 RepID=UPI002A74DE8D|nr:hypothetical protein [Prochlorococcus sp. MIT 1223]